VKINWLKVATKVVPIFKGVGGAVVAALAKGSAGGGKITPDEWDEIEAVALVQVSGALREIFGEFIQ